jgi:hypothetical protein
MKTKHFYISLFKSGLRISGLLVILIDLIQGLTLLVGAEIVGIIEEIYE